MEKTAIYERQGDTYKRVGMYSKSDAIRRGNQMAMKGKWIELLKEGLTSKTELTETELKGYIEG